MSWNLPPGVTLADIDPPSTCPICGRDLVDPDEPCLTCGNHRSGSDSERDLEEPSKTMDEATLNALKESITHWEDNVEWANKSEPLCMGAAACPLCQMFNQLREARCAGCPVKDHTGFPYCLETPYELIQTRNNERYLPERVGGPFPDLVLIHYCEAELKFLRSLLPTT